MREPCRRSEQHEDIEIRSKLEDWPTLTDLTHGPSGETATSIGNSYVVSTASSLSSLRPHGGGAGGLAGVEGLPLVGGVVGNTAPTSLSPDADGVDLEGQMMIVAVGQTEVV